MRSLSAKFVLAGALVSTGSVANAAVTYNVTAIPNVTGGTSAMPNAVNDFGAVTGSARVGTATNAFVYTPSSGSSADIGTLAGTNTLTSVGYGINDAGTVVGGSTTSTGSRDAFIYSNGTLSDIGNVNSPSASSTNAYAINATGEIVGTGTRSPGGNIGFVSNNGAALMTVGTAAAAGSTTPTSQLLAISSSGLATGNSTITSSPALTEAVIYDTTAGTFTTVIPNPTGTVGGVGNAINASGEVVGSALNTSTFANVSFAYSSGVETTLGTLGGSSTTAQGLNDAGLIVGGSSISGGTTHGFIDTAGSPLTDLNSLIATGTGWTLSTAYAISNTGDIVGVGTLNGVANQAYLLTPVPEPASLGILAFGGLLLTRRSRIKA